MNIEALTSDEVQSLIKSLKACTKSIPGEVPLIGRVKDDTPVVDFANHIEYVLHRYRHPLDSGRFSLHIRFKMTNEQLIRVDINNGTHRNPDGTIVAKNHMHVYQNSSHQRKDSVAVPLPDEINDLTSLFTLLEEFLTYTHTQDYGK